MKGYLKLRVVVLLVAALATTAPLALAADEPTIQAREVAFQGESTAWVDDAVVLISGGNAPTLTVSAGLLRVNYREIEEQCTDFTSACYPTSPYADPSESALKLTDATLTLLDAQEGFAAAAARDTHPADAGALKPARATVRAPSMAALSPAEENEVVHSPDQGHRAIYAIEDGDITFSAVNPTWTATGSLEMLLTNAKVHVKGTGPDGKAVERTYTLGSRSEPQAAGTRTTTSSWLTLQSPDATAEANGIGGAMVTGKHLRVHAAPDTLTVLTDASGEAATTKGTYAATGDDELMLRGETWVTPLSYDADAERMTLVVQPTPAAFIAAPDQSAPMGGFAVAGAAAAAGLAAVALAYYWPRFKYALSLLALPLYTRIERDEVLQHDKREEIFTLIREAPGIHAHEISTRTNIGWGTTVYHLKLLEEHGLVVSQRNGRYKRFFLAAGSRDARAAHAVLRNETSERLARYVLEHPGTTQKELCQAVGIQPSLASWHMTRLEGADLVKKVKDGRMVRYFSGPAWNHISGAATPAHAAHAATATTTAEIAGTET